VQDETDVKIENTLCPGRFGTKITFPGSRSPVFTRREFLSIMKFLAMLFAKNQLNHSTQFDYRPSTSAVT
jgi:hypothetical protein